ncbi:hypothetical protein JCM10207_004391 [Rhodosporidiobolus poonsookiae]
MARAAAKRARTSSPPAIPTDTFATLPSADTSTATSEDSKPDVGAGKPTPTSALSAAAVKKQNLYTSTLSAGTPFPQWQHPTPAEAQTVCDLLASVHGFPTRPGKLVDRDDAPAGCGAVPDVLDALIRTILSQNTTSKNSTAAKREMDRVYGRAQYRAVLEGGEAKLEETIRSGGLAKNKSKAILGVLRRCADRAKAEGNGDEGELSLQWLHDLSDEDAMKELISFDMVGIKTASCVLLFCLSRDSFAVDTHVHRITQSLGWVPPSGSVYKAVKSEDDSFTRLTSTSSAPTRDQTFWHLDLTLPSHLKYPLHSLLVRHGRGCVKCSANGVTTQDFVDTCPIEHLVGAKGKKSRGVKGKGKKGAAVKEEEGDEVPVKDAAGRVVGTAASASPSKPSAVFHPLPDAPEESKHDLGAANHDAVKLEDELGLGGGPVERASMPRRSMRGKRVKYEETDGSESDGDGAYDDEDSEDVKPAPRKRARKAPVPAKEKPLTSRARVTKRGTKAVEGKGATDGSSVDRDEAEMSGRGWQGTMHGLEV